MSASSPGGPHDPARDGWEVPRSRQVLDEADAGSVTPIIPAQGDDQGGPE